MRFSLAISVFVLVAVGAGATQAAEHVIVKSNVAQYEPGKLIAADAVIALEKGQSIMLATDAGKVIQIDGPFSGQARGSEPGKVDARRAIQQLIGGGSQGLGGLGGARGPEDETGSAIPDLRPSPWLIHAELTGEQCYVAERQTEFWRNETDDAAQFELREVSTGRAAPIRWQGDDHAADWPAELPPRDGEVYLIREFGRLQSGTSIRVFRLEPGVASDPYAAAAWLAARGCTGQARLALSALDDPD